MIIRSFNATVLKYLVENRGYDRDKTWDNYKHLILREFGATTFSEKPDLHYFYPINDEITRKDGSRLSIKNLIIDHLIHANTLDSIAGAGEGKKGWPYIKYRRLSQDERNQHANEAREKLAKTDQALKNFFMTAFEKAVPHVKYIPLAMKLYPTVEYHEDLGSTISHGLSEYHKLATHRALDPSLMVNNVEYEDGGYQEPPIVHRTPTNIPHTAFNRFQSIDHLMDVVQHPKYYPILQQIKSPEEQKYTTVHSDDIWDVVVPHTWQAASKLAQDPFEPGKKARWCTSLNDANATMFDEYNRDSPLFIFRRKQNVYPHNLIQLHFGSQQFMDMNDRPIGNMGPGFQVSTIKARLAREHITDGPTLKTDPDLIFDKIKAYDSQQRWPKTLED